MFAGTFFFLALLDRRDRDHERVAAFAAEYRGLVLTTRWVLAETANALSASPVRERAAALLQTIEQQPNFRVAGETDRIYERGVAIYAGRSDKAWSLTDCTSFAVMEENGLHEALTGDRHFAQAGFVALFAE